MAKTLKLNTALVMQDYVEKMTECIDRLVDEYCREVTSAMRTDAGRGDLKKESVTDNDKLYLARQIIGGPFAILDSWGSGSLMDTSNPALNEYLNSMLYNPERPRQAGAPITGRPEGEYTNIFGETKYSSGRLAGANLENFPGSPIRPQQPSGAFQDAEKWFKASGRVQELVMQYTHDFLHGIYTNGARYWRLS